MDDIGVYFNDTAAPSSLSLDMADLKVVETDRELLLRMIAMAAVLINASDDCDEEGLFFISPTEINNVETFIQNYCSRQLAKGRGREMSGI